MRRKPEKFMGRPNPTEAFLDVVRLLRSRATLWGTIQATGRWGVSFRDAMTYCSFGSTAGRVSSFGRVPSPWA